MGLGEYPGRWVGVLDRPVYVLKMNYGRMGQDARIKWLNELRKACVDTVARIDQEFKRLGVP